MKNRFELQSWTMISNSWNRAMNHVWCKRSVQDPPRIFYYFSFYLWSFWFLEKSNHERNERIYNGILRCTSFSPSTKRKKKDTFSIRVRNSHRDKSVEITYRGSSKNKLAVVRVENFETFRVRVKLTGASVKKQRGQTRPVHARREWIIPRKWRQHSLTTVTVSGNKR